MRIYEQLTTLVGQAKPIEVGCKLSLRDNGEFVYREFWHGPMWSTGFVVSGLLSQVGNDVTLLVESSTNPFEWPVGASVKALQLGDSLQFEQAGILRPKKPD